LKLRKSIQQSNTKFEIVEEEKEPDLIRIEVTQKSEIFGTNLIREATPEK